MGSLSMSTTYVLNYQSWIDKCKCASKFRTTACHSESALQSSLLTSRWTTICGLYFYGANMSLISVLVVLCCESTPSFQVSLCRNRMDEMVIRDSFCCPCQRHCWPCVQKEIHIFKLFRNHYRCRQRLCVCAGLSGSLAYLKY